MKKLFVLAVVCLGPLAWPALAASKPAQKKPPAATATPTPAPAPAPLPRKPGFWERAWDGSKKVWSATSRTVARPFGGKGSKGGGAKAGWRNLTLTIAAEPATIKVPETRTLRVKVSVANLSKYGVQLDFPSSQRVVALILDDAGKVRAKASSDQKGEPEQGFLVINPDERLEYTATIPLRDLAVGQTYTLEALFPDFPELRTRQAITPVD